MNSARFERPKMSAVTERWIENAKLRDRIGVRLSRSRLQRKPNFERALPDGTIASRGPSNG